MQLKHEQKQCPRCGAGFECKVGDVVNCQCYEVQVQARTNEFLANAYYDCLCKNCLAEIDKMLTFAQSHPLPQQGEVLVEGLHYYKKNNQVVYTELYHLQQGQCCHQPNCMHCAYGFRAIETKSG
ncbi:cysteine-rich CWC family protein [Microscilla marina]|nr:cysteine-rich CWC family protein [Microscilla marina]